MVTRSSPSMPRAIGRAPVATTMCAAFRRRPPTSTSSAPTTRASPWSVCAPAPRSQASMRSATGSVKERLRAMSAGQSMATPSRRPAPASISPRATASAAANSTFLGLQPRRAHVPPYGSLSTTATLSPAAAQRDTTFCAAAPVPITSTSTSVMAPPRESLRLPGTLPVCRRTQTCPRWIRDTAGGKERRSAQTRRIACNVWSASAATSRSTA